MRTRFPLALALVLGLVVLGPLAASAGPESCREWRAEHQYWKTRVVERYLRNAPQQQVDEAVFELLQRETWLTSCDASVRGAREALVGWRLVGRSADEYGAMVLDSLLERAGLDPSLHGLFDGVSSMSIPARPVRARRATEVTSVR